MKKISLFIILFVISVVISINYIVNQLNNINYYHTIKIKQLDNTLISNKEAIIYFYKLDCYPCSLFKGTLNGTIKEKGYDVKAINIMESSKTNIDLIDQYSLKVTPTIIKFANGKEVSRIEGNISKKKLIEFLNK